MAATTISRTYYNTITDDSGSGTDGSFWDKAGLDAILDAIDAIFAGAVIFGGVVGSEAAGVHAFSASTNGVNELFFNNPNGGTAAVARVRLGTDQDSGAGMLAAYGSGFTTSGITIADSVLLTGARPGGVTIAASHASGPVQFYANGATLRARIDAGMQLGAAPTGGDKGAGTLNCSGDIYKNNTAFTNPKWVLQRHFTGTADSEGPHAMPPEYGGLLSIDAARAVVQAHHDLPTMLLRPGGGLFERGDLVLAAVEEAYLYIFQLHDRLAALERAA